MRVIKLRLIELRSIELKLRLIKLKREKNQKVANFIESRRQVFRLAFQAPKQSFML